MKEFVIVGAGFRGFCDALHLLNQNPKYKLHIVDPAPFFGGVMNSLVVDGFNVDKGVHVFDSIPIELADVVNEIMEGQTCEIDFVSASAFNNKITEGFSLPDLASIDDQSTKRQIEVELRELAKDPPDQSQAKTLRSLFDMRYGKTASDIFCNVFKKVYSIGADEVEATAIAQTSMGRLKFLPDDEMLRLKQDEWMDTVLAARRKSVGKVDDFVSIYPDTGEAMKGFCDRAKEWLEAKGVSVHLGEKVTEIEDNATNVVVTTDKRTITADKLIWANDNVEALGKALGHHTEVDDYQHGTPLVFYTLMTQASEIKDFTYLQNFDPDGLTYRTAAAGIFSNQVREDGISFITCECPSHQEASLWVNAEDHVMDVWNECRELGIVSDAATLVAHDIKRIPTSFKLAKIGYRQRIDAFCDEVSQKTNHVIIRNVIPFFRRDIYFDSAHLGDLVG